MKGLLSRAVKRSHSLWSCWWSCGELWVCASLASAGGRVGLGFYSREENWSEPRTHTLHISMSSFHREMTKEEGGSVRLLR